MVIDSMLSGREAVRRQKRLHREQRTLVKMQEDEIHRMRHEITAAAKLKAQSDLEQKRLRDRVDQEALINSRVEDEIKRRVEEEELSAKEVQSPLLQSQQSCSCIADSYSHDPHSPLLCTSCLHLQLGFRSEDMNCLHSVEHSQLSLLLFVS